jgi:hypothetical protein
VLGLISSFMVGDVPVAQMAARVGWHVVPYAAGVGLGGRTARPDGPG